jgi:hypothetical protein
LPEAGVGFVRIWKEKKQGTCAPSGKPLRLRQAFEDSRLPEAPAARTGFACASLSGARDSALRRITQNP